MIQWNNFENFIYNNLNNIKTEFDFVNIFTYGIDNFVLSKCTDVFGNALIYNKDSLDVIKLHLYNSIKTGKINTDNTKLTEGITLGLVIFMRNVNISFINAPGIGISNIINFYGTTIRYKLNNNNTQLEFIKILINILKQYFSTISGNITYSLPNGNIIVNTWSGLT